MGDRMDIPLLDSNYDLDIVLVGPTIQVILGQFV